MAVTRSPFRDRHPPLGKPRPPASPSTFNVWFLSVETGNTCFLVSSGISRPRSGSAPPIPMNILSVPIAPPSATSPPPHNKRLKPGNVSKATSKPLAVRHVGLFYFGIFKKVPPLPSMSLYIRLYLMDDIILYLPGTWLHKWLHTWHQYRNVYLPVYAALYLYV